ncbi:hypothetical protein [Sphingomonas bacterium]|uniref:hypothetical protein n=1 Tax=Sphingomonas bacterium TaxID=1895847 RepID=UPI0015751F99|nr:hypothetical protein [Sphingomonas bacterium]
MQMVIDIMVFSGAFVAASATIAMTVAPQWHRIVRLAAGHPETAYAPLASLVHAERRIAVRHWAAAPILAPIRQLRAAA